MARRSRRSRRDARSVAVTFSCLLSRWRPYLLWTASEEKCVISLEAARRPLPCVRELAVMASGSVLAVVDDVVRATPLRQRHVDSRDELGASRLTQRGVRVTLYMR